MPFHFITKSKILTLNRCAHQLRLNLEPRPERGSHGAPDFGLENRRVKDLSRTLFPGGIEIPKSQDMAIARELTEKALADRELVYNPVLGFEDLVATPDILVPDPSGGYEIWEISTSIHTKKDFELGLAYHKIVAESMGLRITGAKGLKINADYVHEGTLVAEDFFIRLDYTQRLGFSQDTVQALILALRNYRDHNRPLPENHCTSFKSCHYPAECFPHSDDENIFSLRESAKITMDLYNQGIRRVADIPDDTPDLTDRQRIQIATERTRFPHIQIPQIQTFLDQLHFPVFYLDFETINPQIPIYPKTKPYQHIPFLFSLHVWRSPDDVEPEHYDWIQADNQDPRPSILAKLSQWIPDDSMPKSILSFNDFFEKRCIRESTEFYPDYREWFLAIQPYFLDAAIPFKNFYYYHPKQNGSASLKDILPSITDSISSHAHLDIRDGYAANLEYLKLIRSFSTDDYDPIRAQEIFYQLKEYCKMDSYALFLIHKELLRLVLKEKI